MPAPSTYAQVNEDGCHEGFILVPGNSTFEGNDFCVMKYEAKDSGGTAVSQAAGLPWVSISQTEAAAAAEAACSNCELITEAQWLTIAHDVTSIPSNWTGNSVGSGQLYRGHSDEAPYAALAASTNDSDGYSGTDNVASSEQRRTLTLSNGEVIWDLAGNVLEYTSGTVNGGQPGASGYAWREWNAIESSGSVVPDPSPSFGTPAATAWDSSHGIGRVYSSSTDSGTDRPFRRGGRWYDNSSSGVFTLTLDGTPAGNGSSLGFRVTHSPVTPVETQELGDRSITVSSSGVGASDVTYRAVFNITSNFDLRSLVIDFCANSPLIGENCTAPGGFSLGSPPTVSSVTIDAASDTPNWTAGSVDNGRGLSYIRDSDISVTTGQILVIELTGVTNPSSLGTYFGRLLLYGSATPNYSDISPGEYIESGGVAMSTAAQMNISARVSEHLEFCVYTNGTGNDCVGKSGNQISLGDSEGVLDPSQSYVDSSLQYGVQTNASSGVVIRLKGDTMASGGDTIEPLLTETPSTPGTEQFGLCTWQSAGSGLNISTKYDGSDAADPTDCSNAVSGVSGGPSRFALDTDPSTGTTSMFGEAIATKQVGDYSTGTISFIGNISELTEAGSYSTSFIVIAAGVY